MNRCQYSTFQEKNTLNLIIKTSINSIPNPPANPGILLGLLLFNKIVSCRVLTLVVFWWIVCSVRRAPSAFLHHASTPTSWHSLWDSLCINNQSQNWQTSSSTCEKRSYWFQVMHEVTVDFRSEHHLFIEHMLTLCSIASLASSTVVEWSFQRWIDCDGSLSNEKEADVPRHLFTYCWNFRFQNEVFF